MISKKGDEGYLSISRKTLTWTHSPEIVAAICAFVFLAMMWKLRAVIRASSDPGGYHAIENVIDGSWDVCIFSLGLVPNVFTGLVSALADNQSALLFSVLLVAIDLAFGVTILSRIYGRGKASIIDAGLCGVMAFIAGILPLALLFYLYGGKNG